MSSEMPAMVKTEISLAITGIKAPQTTRMSEAIVQGQEEPVFRGIQDVKLFAHVEDPENADEAKRDFWKEIVLPTVDPDNQHQSSDAVAQFYADVEIPLNTTEFRFYGEAKKASGDGYAKNGELVKPSASAFTDNQVANLTFGLKSIQTTVDDKANALADYLTAIASELNTQGFTDAYNKLIKNTAGSSANVFALVSQLYANIKATTAEEIAKKAAVKAVIDGTEQSTLAGYPAGLPDGTARMAWDAEHNKFVIPDDATSSILFDNAPLSAYVYPPALYYYIESGVRTSSTIHMYGYADWLYARQHGYSVKGTQDYDTSWKHFLDMYEYKSDEKVNVYSHSVALADEIRYAVSRLDVTIRANSSSLTDAAGRQVHFTASAFPITGILIGDQMTVDYEFNQKTDATTKWIIYDTDMPDGMILSTSKTPVNSTLVLESCAQDDTSTADLDERVVRVAVEFENNSGFDIYGKSENDSETKPIIPHGTKFYLLGELSLSDAEQPKEDEPALQDRVFKKGAVTKVDFVVSNFEYAYNVVPDLRNPRLMLGLSANLHWQSGIIIPTEI